MHFVLLGIDVITPDGQKRARAAMLLCSVDLPAQVSLLNMKAFNGKCGCALCEDGEPRPTSHLHRNWPYIGDGHTLRTHQSVRECARDAMETGSCVSNTTFTECSTLIFITHFRLKGSKEHQFCVYIPLFTL